MLKIALLGAGNMGRTHLECYLRNEHCRVEYIFDKNIDKARSLTGDTGIKVTEDIDDFLGRGIDAVDICLPTFLHKEYALLAAQAGKHILCEKPMALSTEECDAMIKETNRHGVKYMTAHVLRFWPEYRHMKYAVESMELGRPVCAAGGRAQPPASWSESNWLLDPSLSLGGVADFQIHDLDFISWVFGKPASIISTGSKSRSGAWEQIFTILEFDSGFNCCLEACNLMPKGYPFTASMKLLFTEGCIEYDSGLPEKLKVYRPGEKPYHPQIENADAYCSEINYFIDCVLSDREIEIIRPEDAKSSLYLALKSKESLESGKKLIL